MHLFALKSKTYEKLSQKVKELETKIVLKEDTIKQISKKIPKIVFIHGVGEGVLKSELQSLLNKYSVKYYDASYKKYGLGATEVYVYQNSN